MSATLGGLIKDYRLQKHISQMEIALFLGWSEASRLSRIEQGLVKKPTREIVDRLIQVLKLDRFEEGQLLLAGGYLPYREELNTISHEVQSLLDNWPYPAYLLDFSWRLISWNKPAARVYAIDVKAEEFIKENLPWAPGLVFDPDFFQNKYLKDEDEVNAWHKLLLGKLIRFRYLNRERTGERWYQELISRMMKNKLFANLWQKAHLTLVETGMINYERKKLVDWQNIDKRFDFHIFRSQLLQDARFEINYHIPGDQETLLFFSKTENS
ncbi:TPA: hypothetical protein DIV55_00840 [Patescibacteria group bacterium]|uniref:HTH cro/C1-type domain-containing protein n=1 Tax=Candidatus Gottesmanbacteria bacterium GW2011_GWA1_43_11 TaxID=1618436 RepID=A0A0G1FBU3_9BACT|nr:MAG: hypothetical protein UV59_C0022G0023 [Candidatus Gottesmanbacteria bacterium GW2011_GWA1_43_11]HCS78271.1 hypothetical protein [Patescibacteria group bacterium]